MHIALFGTSADPPTLGHQAILYWLSQRFDRVAVWASDNPFKPQQTRLSHRVAMLNLLIQDTHSRRQNIEIYPELSSPRTLHSIQAAQRIWRDAELTIVIGSDLVPQLPHWYQVEQWIAAVNLLIMPRPGAPVQSADLAELRQMGAMVAIAPLVSPDISSTAYREQGNLNAISPAIRAYIHQAQLYPCQDVPKEKQPIR